MITALTLLTLAAGSLRVELAPAASVRGTELELAAVARVTGDDQAAVAAAGAALLGYAPAPGYARTVERWQIVQELARALPGTQIDVVGAAACRVTPEVELLTAERVLATAREALVRDLAAYDTSLEPAAGLHPLEVPAGDVGVELRARTPDVEPNSGAVSVPVEVLVDGELYRTLWTSWEVGVWTQVPVLAHDVRRGEELSFASFRVERRRVDLATQRGHLSEAAASGAVATRDLREGSVVIERDVTRPKLVTRGRTVQLRVRKGAIVATVIAVARQDGFLGDEIAVVTDSKKEIRAVILGPDLVGIELAATR
jgi:flagella basal body P-ring formation protein FlgA